MSYEVLARRLRPQTFAEVVGQEHVTRTLRNAVMAGRLSHAILLCGPRGVGKTSIARVLARSLNCDQGPTETPCGECATCLEIAGGSSLDVHEIDAASHTGVENVREIRDSVRYAAAPGKHRIFIIDEVHMLSSAAFNALLKTLEEPPPRSLFVLATTDPQKIPATVLSRVQRFDLRRLGQRALLERLQAIAEAESLTISEPVLRGLIRESQGSFRDVLTLLERLVSGLGTQIEDEAAAQLLEWIDRQVLQDVLDPILAHDPAGALGALERALDKGVAPARLAADLLSALRDLLVARLVPEPGSLIDATGDEIEELRQRAASHSPEFLQQLFRVLLTRTQDLGFAPNPAHALEVALVRMATLPETDSIASLLGRMDALLADAPPPPSPAGPPPSARGATQARAGTRESARSAPRARDKGARAERAAAPAPQPPEPAPASPVATPAAPVPAAAIPTAAPSPRANPAAAPPASTRQSDPRVASEEHQRLRNAAKTHPAVLQVLETLDAEIHEIRVKRR